MSAELGKTEQIRKLLEKGCSTRMIAKEVHCSLTSIQKVKNGEYLKPTKRDIRILDDIKEEIQRKAANRQEVDEEIEFEKILIPIIVKKLNDPDIFDSTVKLIVQYYQMPIYADKTLPSMNTAYSRHWYL